MLPMFVAILTELSSVRFATFQFLFFLIMFSTHDTVCYCYCAVDMCAIKFALGFILLVIALLVANLCVVDMSVNL